MTSAVSRPRISGRTRCRARTAAHGGDVDEDGAGRQGHGVGSSCQPPQSSFERWRKGAVVPVGFAAQCGGGAAVDQRADWDVQPGQCFDQPGALEVDPDDSEHALDRL